MYSLICKSSFHLQSYLKRTPVYFKTLALHHLSTTALSSPNPTAPLVPKALIVEHLIKEYGVSRETAMRISPSTSSTTLTSVPHFLKQSGFSDTHIRNLIYKSPKILFSKIDETLKPKLKFLEQELGLTNSSLAEFAVKNYTLFQSSINNYLLPTINVLRSFLHSNENIVRTFNKDTFLVSCRGNKIASNFDFLRRCGIPTNKILYILSQYPRVFTQDQDKLKVYIERVEKLGMKRDSPCFSYALVVMKSLSEATLKKKFEFYKSYGWSESDILSAFSKDPSFLRFSEENIRNTMSYLMDDLGCDPKDIASMTGLLRYSLENRLKPRIKVMNILISKGLWKKNYNLYTIAVYSEKEFMEKFVLKFVDRAPDIRGAYKTSDVPC